MATIETQAPTETSPEEGLLVTPSARATLIRRIADIVVLPSSRISANERAVAGDILIEVLAGVEQAQKMEIARRVATVADAHTKRGRAPWNAATRSSRRSTRASQRACAGRLNSLQHLPTDNLSHKNPR